MRINTNIMALNSWRHFHGASEAMDRSMTRLSSGRRINTGADDAAGLGISERMRSRIRGMTQVMRNVQDGINLVQAAEGTLQEVTSMLQRGRELAVQAANGTWTPEDRQKLQDEMSHIAAEVNRIAGTAEYNKVPLLGGGNSAEASNLVESLRRSWLAPAEALVQSGYGLQGDDKPLKIVMDETGSNPAWVSGTVDPVTGKVTNEELHINMAAFSGYTNDQADRIIAHEMTHAIMGRNMDFGALPDWFREGAAEYIAGADDRVAADLAANGNNVAALVGETASWEGTSIDYSAGYMAIKYLDSRIQATTPGKTIKDLMTALTAPGATLDAAISALTSGTYATAAAFITDYQGLGGQTFVNNYISAGKLADTDVGSIGGGDAVTVVPNVDVNTWDPLAHFVESWPQGATTQGPVSLQVGDLADETLLLPGLQTNSYTLGLYGVDLVKDATGAIDVLGKAISTVSGLRSQLGAIQNRLEHTYNANAVTSENLAAAETRIRDADMAFEMTTYTRKQLLVQTSAAMLAQATQVTRSMVQVLTA